MNPYGECGHTKYEGCPPCIHDAYQRGREDEGREIAEAIFNEHAAVTFPNPTDLHRNGFFLGLQRARDIAEGFQRIAAARGDGAE